MSKLILALHKGCLNKTDPQKVATGWINTEVDCDYLINWVKKGWGWCGTHFVDKHRKKDNATVANLVVFDIDGHISLKDWWGHPKVQQWCALTYTTASHTEASPRFRALFPLNGLTTDPAKHEAVYDAIAAQILPDFEDKYLTDAPFDHGGRQNSKLWYGNTEAQVEANIGCSGVPLWFIEAAVPAEKGPSGPITPADDLDIERARWGLSQLRPSEDGEYNEFFWPITKACAHIGPAVLDAWSAWVARGHHAAKPVNLDHNVKWSGVPCDGSVAKLFYYFNVEMPNWKQLLPAHLKFKAKAKIGYSEAEPSPDFGGGNSETSRASQKTVQKKSGRLSLGDQKDVVCRGLPLHPPERDDHPH